MNERIKELYKQAGFTVARGWGLKDTVPEDVFIANVCVSNEMKKFAELIVFECTKAVMDGSKEGDYYAQRIEQHFDNGAGGVLHFGVEE
jgi:hypothetical protein